MPNKIHFLFDQKKEPDASFANELIQSFGQTSSEQAESIISIGGDGMLLRALRESHGRPVAGIVPPTSGSIGFWTNRGIKTADDLENFLSTAQHHLIKPLESKITYSDGTYDTRRAYADMKIAMMPQELSAELKEEFNLQDNDISLQSALLDLSASFNASSIGPIRIMGTGILFSTPFGSTAANDKYGGPVIDIRNQQTILTGLGISQPRKGFSPRVLDPKSEFDIAVQSSNKRPVYISFDSFGTIAPMGKTIESIHIKTSPTHHADLLLNKDPALNAFSSFDLKR
jgi:NAD+ kinase